VEVRLVVVVVLVEDVVVGFVERTYVRLLALSFVGVLEDNLRLVVEIDLVALFQRILKLIKNHE